MQPNHLRLHSNAAQLLISLVPNNSFRQNYRPSRPFPYPGIKEYDFSSEAVLIIDQIYNVLLQLLKRVKTYADSQTHGKHFKTIVIAVIQNRLQTMDANDCCVLYLICYYYLNVNEFIII